MTTWLHEERLRAVMAAVRDCGARSVLDLGCGAGDLLLRLAAEPGIARVTGIDLSAEALDRLRVRLARLGPVVARVDVFQASMTRADDRLRGFDCAVLVETIEHLRRAEMTALEQAVFGAMRPRHVVITTPNAEFNPLLGVPSHRLRHPGHRFEWNRRQFADWAAGVAARRGYAWQARDIAGAHPDLGGASQMAVFGRLEAGGDG